MKNLLGIILVFSLFLLIIPSVALFGNETELPLESQSENLSVTEIVLPDSYKMLISQTGEVIEIPRKEYLIGAVFAQMPAGFENEALKAQAVLANTYSFRQRKRALSAPDAELKGADFSDDTSVYQAYFTPEQAKSFYGNEYEDFYKKISQAVDEVYNIIALYEGEPIIGAFHSMSGGKTESAEIAWGTDIPYLEAVLSENEAELAAFCEEADFSDDEIKARLEQGLSEIILEESPEEWLKIKEISASGTVLSVKAGSLTLTGKEIKDIFSLRSCFYEITRTEGGYTFFVKGCGHGVGLSQYGANEMAKKGQSYSDILNHYFSGIEISKAEEISQ
ncbi:MAG: stage II sporulation protein D [Oscillospiraceae bacterium]